VSELKVGDRIKDNDPRMYRRILTVRDVQEVYVYADCAGIPVRILRRRIFTDGKPRKTGFSLMEPSNA
jgi:hypothetical protein